MNTRYLKTGTFEASQTHLTEICGYLDEQLGVLGMDAPKSASIQFVLEDILNDLIEHAEPGSRIKVKVKRFFHKTTISLSCMGSRINYQKYIKEAFAGVIDEETEAVILSNLLKIYESGIHVSWHNNINRVMVVVSERKVSQLVFSASAMVLGILAGLMIKTLCSGEFALYLANSVFDTGTSLFLRAIKMVISYLVFFSISSGLSEFRDLKELGRVLGIVLSVFMITSFITIPVTYGIYRILPAGSEALRFAADSSMQIGAMQAASSAKEMLLNVFPENYLNAFLNGDMIQLLVIAVLTGIAVSKMDKHASEISGTERRACLTGKAAQPKITKIKEFC